ncbi:RhoGAP-domain-containing protein [Pleurostoma richardsiae]|uniref:RhoGAP-domain-containing protein n=1 Tax=Pleurostoma richardsiae TaxID=41990 RepID=A0AA38VMV9_9PEZI|nr:RhoGAP-domain-containing protein [Pleurostoma richardsiae]
MSQLALQSAGSQPRSDAQQSLPNAASVSSFSSSPSSNQDSPTIGRSQSRPLDLADSSYSFDSPTHSTGSRFHRKPPPSPLHNSTAISPPASASPSKSSFTFEARPLASGVVPQIVTTSPRSPRSPRDNLNDLHATEQSYYHSGSSRSSSPDDEKIRGPLSARDSNDTRSASDSVLTKRPLGASTIASSPTMAGSSRVEAAKSVPRNSSIDSAISSISAGSHSHKNSQESGSSPADIEKLIKAAGSPQAVIQYLLKEKQSQAQQNAQLWRLVDKQRAMILGLNKDLERALKDKEKYRKKLKEVVAQEVLPLPSITTTSSKETSAATKPALPKVDIEKPKEQVLEIPASPGLDSDSQKLSPVDMTLAPYPITPPADHPIYAPPSAVGDMLDPSHAMPRASEHALDQFDHEAQERDAETARKESDAAKDLPIIIGLPPSRSLPGGPPRVPPPAPPTAAPHPAPFEVTSVGDEGVSQFAPPSAPPPRKPPPAPLQLRDARPSPTIPPDEDFETDSDYDDILEVDEIVVEKRGRRKTREEDDTAREIIALQEAEMRSLSKKSKKSSSAKGTPKDASSETRQTLAPASPRAVPQGMSQREHMQASLAGVLSGGPVEYQLEEDPVFTLAILSRADGGELWRVEKDTSSLVKLDSRLKQCSAFTAKTPDRNLFTGHAPAKLDARRQALDQYLAELLDTPLDQTTALELCKYLSCNTLPPNADETGSASSSVHETARNVGPGGRPFRSGYLTKRGKNFGGWKARFFILDGPHLKYYETPGGAHLGTIKLQNAQIGKQSHQNESQSPSRGQNVTEEADNQYRHAFLILEPKKKDSSALVKHVLCAESDRERDQWVDTLLRWIDYRDPDDEDPRDSKAHDRHGSGNERGNGSNSSKKKAQSSARPQQHQQKDSSDTLISVSYDTTKQGDAPQGAPGRPRTAGGDHDPQPSYTISAPRDPQVISDSASWGNKIGGLAPPNADEKKARKRSFFGFGTKTRTSSDGGDSLFGESSGSSGGNVVYSGPVRQVFGAPLAEAVRYNSPTDVSVPLPAVVYRCIQYLDAKNAILEEGIFRLSGSNVVIKQLRERFNNQSDIDLLADTQYHDIHAVASLLKLYLRELPTTILTRDLHLEFLSVTELSNQREKIAALSELVQRLPQANATLLKYLIAFLIKIINNADMNKMTVRNVGIVFSPTLNIPAPVFAMFLQNYEGIFGIEPEEYELPSPITEEESRPSVDPFPRPATSGNRESPHRQRLMEALQEGQRSSPTPPPAGLNPLQNLQQMRGTPTPPPAARPITYEPQYLAQQSVNSQVSARPAYESGFVVPQGFDPTQLQTPPSGRGNPGYDRPLYESGGLAPSGYDQAYGTKANRRESAIFMGGGLTLNPQGSRSRLREETHF